MKITNLRLAESRVGLAELGKIQFPLRRSFELSKFLRAINDALQSYGDRRNEILVRHAKRDASGKIVCMTEERTEIDDVMAFNKDMKMLDSEMVEISIMKISLSDLGDVSFSPTGLMSLDWLISGDS